MAQSLGREHIDDAAIRCVRSVSRPDHDAAMSLTLVAIALGSRSGSTELLPRLELAPIGNPPEAASS